MSVSSKRCPRVVFFNHKGGVGKTTLTVNLALALHEAGNRVLLVDTDPQCSLSSFFLEEKYLDKLLDQSESRDGNTLWSALQPVSEGVGPLKTITPLKLREGLLLAPGDIRLAQYENSLADCWHLCLSRNRRGYLCTTAMSQLVDCLVRSVKADVVFFDAGPNIGPLNRAVLLDSSHFIVPAACDLFSARALKTLGFALSDWVGTWRSIAEMAPDETPLLAGKPQLLGFVPQGFRVYGGAMAAAPFSILARLGARVVEFVWKPLQEALGLPTREHPTRLKLGEVKYFGTTATLSQEQGEALWNVRGGNASAKADARHVFTAMAQRIIAETR